MAEFHRDIIKDTMFMIESRSLFGKLKDSKRVEDMTGIERFAISPILLPIAIIIEGITGISMESPQDVLNYLDTHLDDKDKRIEAIDQFVARLLKLTSGIEELIKAQK